jgi:hypothetical protein
MTVHRPGPARADPSSPDAGESKYPARARGRPGPEPLKVRIELVVVDGPEAKELLRRQAIAVRDALRWRLDHRPPVDVADPAADQPTATSERSTP